MKQRFIIYYLEDPRDGQIRYIGQTTKSLHRRLICHLTPYALSLKYHKSTWINSLIKEGLRPRIYLLQEINNRDEMNAAEIYWIDFFRKQGCDLTNSTLGGDGHRGGKWTKGRKIEHSRRMKGFKMPEKAIENIRKAHIGVKHSPERVLANSRRQGGRSVMDGNGKTFKTITEAAEFYGISRQEVRNKCKGIRKARNVKGGMRTFKFIDD